MIFGVDFKGFQWAPTFSPAAFYVYCIVDRNCEIGEHTKIAYSEKDILAFINQYGTGSITRMYRVEWDGESQNAKLTPLKLKANYSLQE